MRVVASSAASTTLLVGGLDTTYPPTYPGVLIYGTVAVGASKFIVTGSVALPSFGGGVTALSQTSPLLPGHVLAATDEGVFKCVPICPMPTLNPDLPLTLTPVTTLTVTLILTLTLAQTPT